MKCKKCGDQINSTLGTCMTCYKEKMKEGAGNDAISTNFKRNKISAKSIWESGLRGVVLIFFWAALAGIVLAGFGLLVSNSALGIVVIVGGGFLLFISTAAIMVFLDLVRDVATIRSKLEE